jgi:TonB family protein
MAINNRGLLPLGLVVSLSVTLTGFEYMSTETIKTKKLSAHIIPEDSGVDFIPEIPKPEMPKPDVPVEKPRMNPVVVPIVNPLGPIVVSPIAPIDPFIGSLEPEIGKLPVNFGEQDVIIDSIEKGSFLTEFPTYSEFLEIENAGDRRMKTDLQMKNYVQSEATYPEIARQLNIEGTVYVSFVVDKEGKITDVNIARSVHESLDKEAIKAVKKLPIMIPGKKSKKPVRAEYTIPVKFELK